MPAYWLLKSEPDSYSYDDLVRDAVAEWDGVTNTTAQKNMRSMQDGDRCVIYHTGEERRAMGLSTIVRGPYPDPTDAAGKLVLVDLKPERALGRPVTLAEIKTMPVFEGSLLLKIGRLSVVPLTEAQFQAILSAGG
jgi:predicted RNA-binding protein with PUA-like domain